MNARATVVAALIALAALIGTAALRPLAAQSVAWDARLDSATAVQVRALLDTAAAAGVPLRPLQDKALEGSSKGAPGTRIVAAVRALGRELGTARTILGATASESELVAAAGALAAGATRDDVAHLRDARGGALAVPLVVLADLISRGVPPPAASSAVTDLARAGAPDDAYAALRRAVEQDIARGTPGAAAAESRARAMLGTLPPPRLTPPAGATDQTAGHAPTPP